MTEDTLRDYQQRMNRVLDHIRHHLDEPLALQELAAVACFSQFHFHRIFAAHVGETLSQHIRRLRLELAAHRLCHSDLPITDIALSAGYETPSAFNKAFKRHFRMSPSSFKKERRPAFFSQPISLQLRKQTTKETTVMMTPEMRTREDTKVIYVRRLGKYGEQAGKAWEALCKIAGPKGLIADGAEFIGISYDDPSVTPEDKLRYDACISVKGDVQPDGEMGVQTIPAGRCAVFLHKGPYENLYATYKAIYAEWLPQSGEKLRDQPCFEKYLNCPQQVKPADLLTEIFIPVQ